VAPNEASRNITYRAQGIPATYNLGSTKQLLQSILEPRNEHFELDVNSLAPDPYESGENGKRVATFTCRGISSNLPAAREQREYPLVEDKHNASSFPFRKLQVSIDTHFRGFTPLSSSTSDESKLEYVMSNWRRTKSLVLTKVVASPSQD
jgi:hypothetical protein